MASWRVWGGVVGGGQGGLVLLLLPLQLLPQFASPKIFSKCKKKKKKQDSVWQEYSELSLGKVLLRTLNLIKTLQPFTYSRSRPAVPIWGLQKCNAGPLPSDPSPSLGSRLLTARGH